MEDAIRRFWNASGADAEAARNAFSVRKEPRFNGAYGHTKAHLWGRHRKPFSQAGRDACKVSVQVKEHNPRSEASRFVVAAQALQQLRLALSPIDGT
jgi:hypothetical protein